jgi:hypothetical protein
MKKGTKEGTHPRLTVREHNNDELSPFASRLTAMQTSEQSQQQHITSPFPDMYNAASRRGLFARTVHGQPKKVASVARRTQINSQRRRPVQVPRRLHSRGSAPMSLRRKQKPCLSSYSTNAYSPCFCISYLTSIQPQLAAAWALDSEGCNSLWHSGK